MKYILLALIACIGLLSTSSCNKKDKKTSKNANKENTIKLVSDEKINWYAQAKNYGNKEIYHNNFLKDYKNCINNKDYEQAKLLLFNFGLTIDYFFETDSLFSNTTAQFLQKKYEVNKDSTYALLHYMLGFQKFYNNEIKNALILAEQSLEINKEKPSKNVYKKAKKLVGICYNGLEQTEDALVIYNELITLAEQDNNDLTFTGSLYYNKAYLYDKLSAYNESKILYLKAANCFLAAKDTTRYFAQKTFFAFNNFTNTKDTAYTLKFIDTILVEFKDYKFPKKAIDSVGFNDVKALKYYLIKQYDTAFFYNNKTMAFYKNASNFLSDYELFDAEIHFKKYSKLKSRKKIETLIEISLANKNTFKCLDLYHLLYENAKAENNFKEALFYRNKEIALSDTLLQANQKGQQFEYDIKYQSEKKEQQILLQKAALKDKNKTITLLFAAIGFIVLLVLTFRFWQSRKKIKNEKQMTDAHTKQLFEKTEEERKRIATDLHDSISHELMGLKNANKEEFAQVNQKIDTIIDDIRIISRNLHPVLFDKVGLQITLEQMVERAQLQNDFMLTAEIDYNKSLSQTSELQLYRIIQEAVTNMVKYSGAIAGKILIQETNSHVVVEIKDNGKGFNVTETLNSSKAFGLHNIIERSKAIGGVAKIKSDTLGTVIFISIPKTNI